MPPLRQEIPKSEKVQYVLSQGQTRDHHCHWPGCPKQCPPAMWGCKKHWMMLPKYLRDKVWVAYRPGQEATMTPSSTYLEVAKEVQQWIAKHSEKKSGTRFGSTNRGAGTGSKSLPTSCIACEDTGVNSKGGPCVPCQRREANLLKTISLEYLFDG